LGPQKTIPKMMGGSKYSKNPGGNAVSKGGSQSKHPK